MKYILSLLGFLFCVSVYAQKKHQFQFGLDYAFIPMTTVGVDYKSHRRLYNSINYSFFPGLTYVKNERWCITIMYQYYREFYIRTTPIKLEDIPDRTLKERYSWNFDLLFGYNLLKFTKSKNKIQSKSTLTLKAGVRIFLPGSMYLFYSPPSMPYYHLNLELIDPSEYGFLVKTVAFRPVMHLNYQFHFSKRFYANANLNYARVFKEGSPLIGQVGLGVKF